MTRALVGRLSTISISASSLILAERMSLAARSVGCASKAALLALTHASLAAMSPT